MHHASSFINVHRSAPACPLVNSLLLSCYHPAHLAILFTRPATFLYFFISMFSFHFLFHLPPIHCPKNVSARGGERERVIASNHSFSSCIYNPDRWYVSPPSNFCSFPVLVSIRNPFSLSIHLGKSYMAVFFIGKHLFLKEKSYS